LSVSAKTIPSSRWPLIFASSILLVGFLTMLAVNLPGHLEFDSIRQLLEGRRGVYSNWHPPVMSWLLGVADTIEPGAAAFVILDAAMVFGGMVSLLWLVERPSWWVVPAAAISVALPQLFLFPAIVWKDILLAASCLVAFALLAHAAALWNQCSSRIALLAGSVVFIALAALSRQNGVLFLPCAAAALGTVAVNRDSWRTGLLYGAGFAVASTLIAIAANAALQLRASHALGPIEQLEDLQLYDIAGMLNHRPELKLSVLDRESPKLANRLRTIGPRLYTPIGHDRLTDDAEIRSFIVPSVSVVRRQWRELAFSTPLTYLAVRAHDFSWLFLSQHPNECLTYAVGVIGPVTDLRTARLRFRYDSRDRWLDEDYAAPLVTTPVFSHPAFAAAGLFCLVYFLWRRRPADLAIAGLLIGTLVYALSYFFIGISCQYRYLYVIDLSAMGASLYLLADFRSR
jgi:hypothetical protein